MNKIVLAFFLKRMSVGNLIVLINGLYIVMGCCAVIFVEITGGDTTEKLIAVLLNIFLFVDSILRNKRRQYLLDLQSKKLTLRNNSIRNVILSKTRQNNDKKVGINQ